MLHVHNMSVLFKTFIMHQYQNNDNACMWHKRLFLNYKITQQVQYQCAELVHV